jgi:adenylate cyclase
MPLKRSRVLINEYAYPILAPLVALLLVLVTIHFGLFERLENLTINFRFQTRERFDPKPDPRVILVRIDQTSLDNIGRWPWDRSIHGDFCQLAAAANVSVLGFDILFTEPQAEPKNSAPAKGGKGEKGNDVEKGSDADFADAAAQVRAVVTGANFDPKDLNSASVQYDFGKTKPFTQIEGDVSKIAGQNVALLPIPKLLKTSFFGFVESAPEGSDGIRRSLPLLARVGKDVFPGLSLQMLCQYWNIPADKVIVRLGSYIELPTPAGITRIPINDHGEMLLNYRLSDSYKAISEGINAVSYAKLEGGLALHYAGGQELPKELPSVDDKILLVGETAFGATDFGPTPLEPSGPLVAVHLTALNNILTGDYLTLTPISPVVFGWLIVCWATLLYLRKKSIVFSIVVPVLCVALYLIAAEILFIKSSLLIPLVWPVIFFTLLHFGIIVLRWLEEQQSRQQIKQTFSRYIAPSILDKLLENPNEIKLAGSTRSVTMLFSDIRGFSSMSENMGAEELVLQLNEYFEKMVGCVNRYRGTLHKYIGDAVMAAWGDVLHEKPEVDAANAVRSALAMRAELILLNKMWAEQKRPQLRIGVGLNHGSVHVGEIGATQRREFTVIGDPVNLASRLEGVTKEYHTDIAIGESVRDFVHGQFLMRTLGVIVVKGKSKPVKVYEVLDDLEKPVGLWPADWVAEYEEAMASYFAKNFRAARGGFKKCLQKRPEDYCSKLYLEICDDLIAHPPSADWDGTQVMKTK